MFNEYQETQPVIYESLKSALNNDKLSHAYLFEFNQDPFPFAISFVKEILTLHLNDEEKAIINRRIDDSNYPEIKIIEPSGLIIKKEQLRQLQEEFSLKPVEGKYKIYIIKEADKLNDYAANSILKFLEEPEEGIIAILLTTNRNLILPTIISRCQVYSLTNVSSEKEYQENILNQAHEIIRFIESDSDNVLAYKKELLPTEKVEFLNILEVIIAYYRAVLLSKTPLFNDITVNNPEKVHLKIDKLLQYQSLISYNININLLFDKMLIEMKAGEL